MKRVRIALVAAAVAVFTMIPLNTPAYAAHSCGLDDPTLNAVCEAHPNDYKTLLHFLFCLVSPTC